MSGCSGPAVTPVCCHRCFLRLDDAFTLPVTTWAFDDGQLPWTRILDHCADVDGAPLTRTLPRQSWGRGPSPLGVAANPGPSVDVSFTVLAVQRRMCCTPTRRHHHSEADIHLQTGRLSRVVPLITVS